MFEAYSVAIRLKLLDSVSSGLIGMAGHFSAFNSHVNASQANLKALEGQLQRLKMMGFLGGAMMGVGAAGLFALKAPLEEAKQWQQEAARFASLGFGSKVNQDAQQFALGMKTYGTSARENLTLVSDAMAVFKDLGHAEMAAPIMARMKFANEAVFGERGAGNERKFMDMLKVIEFRRGLSSPQEFESQANYVQKVISGSRGRVDATQLLMALKTGGVATSQLSNEAFYLGLEPLIQEFGGSRLGTGLMSVYQNLVQSRGTITAQQELYRLGLLNPKRVQFNSLGMLKKALPGAFLGSEVLEQEGPLALLEKVLLPAFAKKGITSEEGIIRELGMILGNRTASGLMSRIYQQRGTIAMQASANRNAMDINQLAATGQNTPEGKMIELSAKWRDVLRELGIAVLPIAIKAVEGLTFIVKGLLGFAREFPTLTKGLVIAFAVLSGLMVAGGAVTLATAGFKALGLALVLGKGAGLGGMLLEVAGGLGAIASKVGTLGLLTGVGAASYAATRWIANKVTPDDWTFGGWLYDKTHASPGSRYVMGGAKHGTTVHTQINMDGRKVAEAVTGHQARAASRPIGGAAFDPTLTMPSVALPHGR